MTGRESLFSFLRRPWESGHLIARSGWFWRYGLVTVEVNRITMRFGVSAGIPWYLGVLLGPLAITFGRRTFVDTPRLRSGNWTITPSLRNE